jgi:predicted nuclease of predicted toxin-antitoxin system
MSERDLDGGQARRIGLALRQSGTSDVVDATVIDIAEDGDTIITSDPDDIKHLTNTAGLRVRIVPI